MKKVSSGVKGVFAFIHERILFVVAIVVSLIFGVGANNNDEDYEE
jgi:hypothetical protein